MIVLRTEKELELTFEKLMKTMRISIEWNKNFIVIGDYLILQGRVRSLFFNFENRKVLTNVMDFPVQEDQIITIEKNERIRNLFNMVLYAFGKWGVIKGLKVEKDYAMLNTMFLNILKPIGVEPGFDKEHFRFYEGGIRLNYEDVVQMALREEREEQVAFEESKEKQAGLWHKIIWKPYKCKLDKRELSIEERKQRRIGNNFYRVGYLCPKCGEVLHQLVYPEGKETLIDSTEGRIYLTRVYTCEPCMIFFAARPDTLFSQGDLFAIDFEEDMTAYEDYQELLGKDGDLVSNFHYNWFENQKHNWEDELKQLQDEIKEMTQNPTALSEEKLEDYLNKIEEGFYAGQLAQTVLPNLLQEKKSRSKKKDYPDDKIEQQNTSGTENRKEQANSFHHKKRDTQMASDVSITEQGSEDESWNPQVSTHRTDSLTEQTEGNTGTRTENAEKTHPADRQEQLQKEQKEIDAKLQMLDRMSEGQRKKLRDQIEHFSLFTGPEKDVYIKKIEEAEEQAKVENLRNMISRSSLDSYPKVHKMIEVIEKEPISEDVKQEMLRPLTEKRKFYANEQVRKILSRIPPSMDRERYKRVRQQLDDIVGADKSIYEPVLEQYRDRVEENEIKKMISGTNMKSRERLHQLHSKLKAEDFKPEIVEPYLEKITDKIRQMDMDELDQICDNMLQMSSGELLDAYQKVEQGMFLPDLKQNTLDMLKKRIEKIKVDECELLVNKLKKSMPNKMIENERYHFYPARKIMKKEAAKEETEVIFYALDTFASTRGTFEYPILVVDTSRNHSGKEGMILTPEHIFYNSMFHSYDIPIPLIVRMRGQSGLLNAGLIAELKDGTKVKIPYAVERNELPVWAGILNDFVSYLKERPDSRTVEYLAKEQHETICCFRCGYHYKGGNICPKCGYQTNK